MPVEFVNSLTHGKVSVLIPCHNEEATIGQLLQSLRDVLPFAELVVIDNASTDATAKIAAASGAVLLTENRIGKGYAVNSGLNYLNSQYILLIDGDLTYKVSDSVRIISELQNGADMVVATRIHSNPAAYRQGHKLGNYIFTKLQKKLLGVQIEDTLSGFRGFNQAFLKTFTTDAKGFEIEAHLNIHSAVLNANVVNFKSEYIERPFDSKSKLNTYKDGLRILKSILRLLVKWRPLAIFGILGSILFLTSLIFLSIPVLEFLKSGHVLHIPTLIAASALGLVSFSMIFFGFIANEVVNVRIETARRDFRILKLFIARSL